MRFSRRLLTDSTIKLDKELLTIKMNALNADDLPIPVVDITEASKTVKPIMSAAQFLRKLRF